jgi:hypothetical protein
MAPVIALVAATLLAQQPVPPPTQVVIPTYQHDKVCWAAQPCHPNAENLCWNLVACEGPLPAGSPMPPQLPPPCGMRALVQQLPGCPEPTHEPLRWEMRSKALFWTGLGLVAGGATLMIGATTWGRESEPTNYLSAPCGTDPLLVRIPVAPCRVSPGLVSAGAALASGGGLLMIYGGQHVLVGADGRQVVIRVAF